MKRVFKSIVVLSVLVTAISCSGGGSEGGDVPVEVTNQYEKLGKAARDAGGDFDKLSEADKKAFVERAGSEAEARKMVGLMLGGPPTNVQSR